MSKKSNLGIKYYLNINWFWTLLSIYIVVGLYLLLITYSAPFLSIELIEKDGEWIVDDPYYTEWAEKNNLAVGDTILRIDNIDIHQFPFIKFDHSIRSANLLTFKKPDNQIIDIEIHHLDIPQQFYLQLVIPSFYFVITLFLALYLYLNKNKTPSLNILIIFILVVSLAYISSSASGRLNSIGLIVNGLCMLLCLVLLIQFFKSYFTFLKIKLIFLKNIELLYIVPLISIFFSMYCIINPKFLPLRSVSILSLFILLLILALCILIRNYFKYKIPQLKILFIGIIVPFLPFFFFFVLPKLLFQKHILSAETCALFLLLIPCSFIFTQLTERLFDIEYYITRLRYYIGFSFSVTLWILVGLYFITDRLITLDIMVNLFFFVFLSLIALLYVKEKIDYSKRKVLFSTKGDYIHRLYTTIDKIGRTIEIESLLNKFSQEVRLHLEIDCVYILTYDFQKQLFTLSDESANSLISHFVPTLIDNLELGKIQKVDSFYFAFIHQDLHYKRILVLNPSTTIQLKDEELLWLELLILYVNNFMENTKMIEELIEELKQMKQTDDKQLPWFNKLLWLRFEEEKYKLAQELHDTNLQEQLHIAREVDLLIHTKESDDIQINLAKIHKQMLTSLHDLRLYCESLKPPLLNTLGLDAALEKFIKKIEERADFTLIYTFDRLYLEDERLNLVIYRLFQEILNNAIKHSFASTVEIHLKEVPEGFEIIYSDNGVGCDLLKVMQSDSMGIKGMQEKVQIFNGQIQINSQHQEGMSIRIKVIEGSETFDYDAYSR